MLTPSVDPQPSGPRHRVRELVCSYRPLRDGDGCVVQLQTLVLHDLPTAASTLAPLIAGQGVEVCANRVCVVPITAPGVA
jgi:hypothetical protein